MNRIKTEYVKRNIILTGSGLIFMVGSVLLYKNVIIMLLVIIASIICCFLGAFEYPRYYLAIMLKGKDYEELSSFYFNKRSLNDSDRSVLITSLTEQVELEINILTTQSILDLYVWHLLVQTYL